MGAENLAPTGIRSLEPPARSESLYRLPDPGPLHLLFTTTTTTTTTVSINGYDSSVATVTKQTAGRPKTHATILDGGKTFLSSKSYIEDFRGRPTSSPMNTGGFCPDYSRPYSEEFMNEWSYTSAFPYTYTALCFINTGTAKSCHYHNAESITKPQQTLYY
jgi:hypothetical protein